MSGRGGNGLGTKHPPGERLGFHQVKVGFPGRNTSHPENQSPAQTGGSVGKITFKCNIRQSHIFAVFGTARDRGRKVGSPDPRAGPPPWRTNFYQGKTRRTGPGRETGPAHNPPGEKLSDSFLPGDPQGARRSERALCPGKKLGFYQGKTYLLLGWV